MAVKTNMKDIGWMYHSPAKHEDRPEVRVPPTSQIPGLGNMPDDMLPPEKEPRQGLIKDTDTPYIVMAKNGGRKDLLCIRENQRDDDAPAKGYPRCDWFYQEDNSMLDDDAANQREPWVFRLPDYMVHQPWNAAGKPGRAAAVPKYGPGERGRPPFATEQDVIPNHMVRFDKRSRLPEARKQGVGVRNEKAAKKASQQQKLENQELTVKARPHNENELRQKARRGGGFQNPNDEQPGGAVERPAMDKLLSMGYAKEWQDSHDAYEHEKAEAARRQAEKLRGLQARAQARETQQMATANRLADRPGGQGGGVSTTPWKPTSKGGHLL
ncbi:hypothetical protein BOX15_Mlig022116g1 [Macrostomum lignano]|uniref:DUF3824 domain-containing protein n=2 Tax=Macrostomum lignano TaxID=282301 RepID=A0A1I8HTA1_9PLAT|nr:hypothetical protein BOX15_Mlig022116g1 [Macrostomum lignano]